MARAMADAATATGAPDAASSAATTTAAAMVGSARAPRPPCRAMALKGTAALRADDDGADAGAPRALMVGDRVSDDTWLALGPGASLTVEDGRSGRDILLTGLADVRACVDDEEETWVARGTFESSPGSGEVPGAEEWVVTPFAVVRYSGAKVIVQVEEKNATVQVKTGVAHAYLTHPRSSIPGAGELPVVDHWTRIEAGKSMDLGTGDNGAWRTRDDASRCAAMANSARDLADRLHNPTDPSIIADLGPKHVAARLAARAACAVAALRVDRLAGTPANANARRELTSVIRVADGSWRGTP